MFRVAVLFALFFFLAGNAATLSGPPVLGFGYGASAADLAAKAGRVNGERPDRAALRSCRGRVQIGDALPPLRCPAQDHTLLPAILAAADAFDGERPPVTDERPPRGLRPGSIHRPPIIFS